MTGFEKEILEVLRGIGNTLTIATLALIVLAISQCAS